MRERSGGRGHRHPKEDGSKTQTDREETKNITTNNKQQYDRTQAKQYERMTRPANRKERGCERGGIAELRG